MANIFLEVLFYDVKLTYAAPIISQHGKIVGKLHFDIEKIAGHFPKDRDADAFGDGEAERDTGGEEDKTIQYRVRVHEASGISTAYSRY